MPVDFIQAPPAVVQAAAPRRAAGRGGLLLPQGYLSTRGSQIVAADGSNVRIASIGWNGADGPPGACLSGLWAQGYTTIMDSIVDAGFNTVRIGWTDAGLNTPFRSYDDKHCWIHVTYNFDLVASETPDARGRYHFLKAIDVFEKVVDYAGRIGLKVIFDHHSNEGTAGQQKNGLWFDLGPGADNTDGVGPGTVTAAQFKENWVALAKRFAGNATVIGFDLHNEPNGTNNSINWGKGGPTDIKAMCEDVGAAVQAVNPGPLIICEGPEQYKTARAEAGFKNDGPAPEGDLSAAAENPVSLPVKNKLVYSVHEYPNAISAVGYWGIEDSGDDYVRRMNRSWGYLVRDGVAPVWIGEMGASMRTPEEKRWAQTVVDYMNGKYAHLGGPAFGPGEQPVSGCWWLIGVSDDTPYGIQTEWGLGNYRPAQLEITDQLLMRAPPSDTGRKR